VTGRNACGMHVLNDIPLFIDTHGMHQRIMVRHEVIYGQPRGTIVQQKNQKIRTVLIK
jgi:hypothetical protein